MRYKFQILLVIFLYISQSITAQKYSFNHAPSWVKEIEIPTESSVSKYDIMSGYYFSLADYQFNLEEEAVYSRDVINVVSYSGITNASQLAVSYDTSYQELIINHLIIWRNGKKLDRTNNLSFEIVNNEENLQEGIYTGTITAYDILNDIRKDDKIDFAYTLIGDNPIFNKEKYLFLPLELMNPVDYYSVRILYPKEKEYSYKCVDCDSINFSDTTIGNNKLIEINYSNLKGFRYEDYMPNWSIPYKYFSLSSTQSWQDVNTWAQKVFTLDKEPQLDAVFDEIFTGEETTEEKINKIIDYVQDDIRYMGIESGIGSIKPFPPEQVVEQRFGDCKDKSLLLVWLLKKIGISKAYPVLVNVYMQQEVDKFYPSGQVFNHCIARFNYNDTTYWVDPTISQQGGNFKNLYNKDYGKSLIIGLAADSLQNMAPKKIKSGAVITETITTNSFSEPSTLKIVSQRYGNDADQRRLALEYYPTKDLVDKVTDDLKLLYPEVNSTKDIDIRDNIDSNIVVVEYNYEVDKFWVDGDKDDIDNNDGYWSFKFEPTLLYQYLSKQTCEKREYDYAIIYPLDIKYRVIFHFPKEVLISDDYKAYENEGFFFDVRYEQLSNKSLQIDYSFRTKSDYVKAKDYLNMCEEVNTISGILPVIIYFTK